MANPFDQRREDYLEGHQRLLTPCRLDLGGWEATDRPTDQRIAAGADRALAVL